MRFYHFILVDTTQVEGALYVSLYIEYHVLFSYSSGGMWYLDLLEMVFTLWHCITLHDIWSYVANLWLRPYRYSIVITMRLHTLLGMKAGDMAFVLHIHYEFGLWYIGIWSYVAA